MSKKTLLVPLVLFGVVFFETTEGCFVDAAAAALIQLEKLEMVFKELSINFPEHHLTAETTTKTFCGFADRANVRSQSPH